MQDVQHCDEELVSILLLVAGQVSGVGPHQVEQLERDVGVSHARVELSARCNKKQVVTLFKVA